MANVLNVKPTKVELQRLKNQLALAQNGYDLLKNKSSFLFCLKIHLTSVLTNDNIKVQFVSHA